MYEMYNPTLEKIEVLKLEKRLDEELLYLRDAPAEYSTFPFNMDKIPHPAGASVPVSQMKVSVVSLVTEMYIPVYNPRYRDLISLEIMN